MFTLRLGKPKDDLKYVFKISGECLGRQIAFGVSQQEVSRWTERGRKIFSDVRRWKKRGQSTKSDRGAEPESKKGAKSRPHEPQSVA